MTQPVNPVVQPATWGQSITNGLKQGVGLASKLATPYFGYKAVTWTVTWIGGKVFEAALDKKVAQFAGNVASDYVMSPVNDTIDSLKDIKILTATAVVSASLLYLYRDEIGDKLNEYKDRSCFWLSENKNILVKNGIFVTAGIAAGYGKLASILSSGYIFRMLTETSKRAVKAIIGPDGQPVLQAQTYELEQALNQAYAERDRAEAKTAERTAQLQMVSQLPGVREAIQQAQQQQGGYGREPQGLLTMPDKRR